ncbi:MAG: hypothetical protein SOS22_05500 [Absicoccus sp.]|uniref:hypothetical protein n=1 Tax=Absicoccus sp. TaxID=2718527 RepID=UPI002A749B4B|nr:hypothetical protein [Absicoccus sp.]MDY3035654.1 hypothetical protein [Absicoccus sp.]
MFFLVLEHRFNKAIGSDLLINELLAHKANDFFFIGQVIANKEEIFMEVGMEQIIKVIGLFWSIHSCVAVMIFIWSCRL